MTDQIRFLIATSQTQSMRANSGRAHVVDFDNRYSLALYLAPNYRVTAVVYDRHNDTWHSIEPAAAVAAIAANHLDRDALAELATAFNEPRHYAISGQLWQVVAPYFVPAYVLEAMRVGHPLDIAARYTLVGPALQAPSPVFRLRRAVSAGYDDAPQALWMMRDADTGFYTTVPDIELFDIDTNTGLVRWRDEHRITISMLMNVFACAYNDYAYLHKVRHGVCDNTKYHHAYRMSNGATTFLYVNGYAAFIRKRKAWLTYGRNFDDALAMMNEPFRYMRYSLSRLEEPLDEDPDGEAVEVTALDVYTGVSDIDPHIVNVFAGYADSIETPYIIADGIRDDNEKDVTIDFENNAIVVTGHQR